MNTETHICAYCGAPATHQFKNGKWCCQLSKNKCPAIKKMLSEKTKRQHAKQFQATRQSLFVKGSKISSDTSKWADKYPPRGEHVCVYCGGYADFQLKDGRWCCQPHTTQCPFVRSKNRSKHIGMQPPEKTLELAHLARRGMRSWNSGLTKDTDERIKKLSEEVVQKYKSGELTPAFKGKHHTEETKLYISQIAKQKKYIDHFGFHKTYEYQGLKFHSSYELQLAKELDSRGTKWQQPKWATFQYVDQNGKQHSYTPDFYLPDYDVYLDPKNDFLIEQVNPTLGYCDMEKIRWVMEQNPGSRIIVLRKDQLDWESVKSLIEGYANW